jgi:hypothetical protein
MLSRYSRMEVYSAQRAIFSDTAVAAISPTVPRR